MMLLLAFTLDLGIAAQGPGVAGVRGQRRPGDRRRQADRPLQQRRRCSQTCASILANDGGEALAIAKKQADGNRPYDLEETLQTGRRCQPHTHLEMPEKPASCG